MVRLQYKIIQIFFLKGFGDRVMKKCAHKKAMEINESRTLKNLQVTLNLKYLMKNQTYFLYSLLSKVCLVCFNV